MRKEWAIALRPEVLMCFKKHVTVIEFAPHFVANRRNLDFNHMKSQSNYVHAHV
jgi:hypothetical protein